MHGYLEIIACAMVDHYSRREEQVVIVSTSEAADYIQSSEESVKTLKKYHFKIKHMKEV